MAEKDHETKVIKESEFKIQEAQQAIQESIEAKK
jgi:hypothetical protein